MTIPWAQPPGLGGANSDTNMAIYTHISSNFTNNCPISQYFGYFIGVLGFDLSGGPLCPPIR